MSQGNRACTGISRVLGGTRVPTFDDFEKLTPVARGGRSRLLFAAEPDPTDMGDGTTRALGDPWADDNSGDYAQAGRAGSVDE